MVLVELGGGFGRGVVVLYEEIVVRVWWCSGVTRRLSERV